MDPLENAAAQQGSRDLLSAHGEALAAQARAILRHRPDAALAGLILEPEAPQAAQFRQMLRQGSGQLVPRKLMVGLVPASMVEPIVQDGLGDLYARERAARPQTQLPVVVAARDGYRVGVVPCDPDAGDESAAAPPAAGP